MEDSAKKQPVTFTDFLRVRFKGLLDPIGRFLNHLGLMPNTVTILGLVGNVGAAYLLATGQLTWGGVVVLLMGPIDALDGTMARLRGETTRFGAFVDSVTDRYSELVILLGLLVYYLRADDALFAALVYLAAAGSVLVSYVRARAEALNFDAKVGLLSRVERYLVLVPCLLFRIPAVAVVILAVFTNFTALQRILAVRKQAYEQQAVQK